MDVNFRPNLSKTAEQLLNTRCVVNADGRIGTISNVLPDADGNPYSIHVHVDSEGDGAPPRVLALDEVTLVSLDFTGEISPDALSN